MYAVMTLSCPSIHSDNSGCHQLFGWDNMFHQSTGKVIHNLVRITAIVITFSTQKVTSILLDRAGEVFHETRKVFLKEGRTQFLLLQEVASAFPPLTSFRIIPVVARI